MHHVTLFPNITETERKWKSLKSQSTEKTDEADKVQNGYVAEYIKFETNHSSLTARSKFVFLIINSNSLWNLELLNTNI